MSVLAGALVELAGVASIGAGGFATWRHYHPRPPAPEPEQISEPTLMETMSLDYQAFFAEQGVVDTDERRTYGRTEPQQAKEEPR